MSNILASNAKARKTLYDKVEDCYGFPRALGKLFAFGCKIGKAIMFLAFALGFVWLIHTLGSQGPTGASLGATQIMYDKTLGLSVIVLGLMMFIGFKIWLISIIIVWFAVQWGYRPEQ